VIHMEQRQLLPQARFALAQGIDPAPDRRHALMDIEVEPVTVDGRIAPSIDCNVRSVGRKEAKASG
jgi:hypothetical protein